MTVQDDEHLAAQAIESGAYEEAIRLLEPLAERNSEYALLSLGWIYENGVTGAPDINLARLYYERAAVIGSSAAHFYIGQLFVKDGNTNEARMAFEVGAKLGNNDCKSELKDLNDSDAEQHAADALEDKNYNEAAQILRPLAERGSQYALMSLGWIYETGAIGTPDIEAARHFYERAAMEGSAPAYFELGRLLLRQGEETQARSAFKAGAERGDIACMSRLGKMMVEGRGGVADIGAGSAWLESAAEQGQISAQRTLLGIEEQNARSVFEKLSIKRKIASLVKKGVSEMLNDPHSDKVR